MQKFNNKIIQFSKSENKIGIIEEEFFKGDDCVMLSNYLKAFNIENKIFLSCDGCYPHKVNKHFLFNIEEFDFLIGFSSKLLERPDFAGLFMLSRDIPKGIAVEKIEYLRNFIVIQKGILFPENITNLLLKNPNM
ncbi:MAG: hypothetical protein NC818_05065 [Candidatus Omnitrophica bacterium]|nr:hypothetical protein [Candidatus Omnitrophota bacterium]